MGSAKLLILGTLIIATAMEVTGDAVIRLALAKEILSIKLIYFVAGGALLFGYGYALNSAAIEFEKVVGLYIVTLFIMWQIVSFVFFRHLPTLPILVGGSLIVFGGLIVTFWQSASSSNTVA